MVRVGIIVRGSWGQNQFTLSNLERVNWFCPKLLESKPVGEGYKGGLEESARVV